MSGLAWGRLAACRIRGGVHDRFPICPTVAITAIGAVVLGSLARAAEPLMLAGPAMGTTYRVALAAEVPGLTRGALHREIEAVLARIDAAASTWRDDSDVSRFNRAAAGEWVEIGDDLARIVAIARQVHGQTEGAFDITVGSLVRLWRAGRRPTDEEVITAQSLVGMDLVESRAPEAGRPAALRKTRDGVTIDLGGIGPGYAVDELGKRLAAIGSQDHLVELGGEARAWGDGPDGRPWRVAVRGGVAGGAPAVVELAAGEAIAFATLRSGRSPVDPRTGCPPAEGEGTFMARAGSCAVADARAVARAVSGK